jgi:hypothetical protein
MEKLFDLVLKSALPNSENALVYWNEANQLVPLEKWPGEISRLASCFYSNYRKELNILNLPLLRGIYKSNWSRNSLALSALIPFVRELDSSGIEYRLIKGGAIILYCKSIGIRRMGDLDLVIPKHRRRKTQSILSELGFVPRYPGDRRSKSNEIRENSKGVVLDIHYVNRFHTFNSSFTGLREVTHLGNSFKLPSIEASVLIAAVHGCAEHSNGDYYQSTWDISMLYPLVDERKLSLLAKKYGVRRELYNLLSYLNRLGVSTHNKTLPTFAFSKLSAIREVMIGPVKSLSNFSMPRILNFSNFRIRYFLSHLRELDDWYYLVWGMFGMIRPLERIFVSKKGLLGRNRKIQYQEKLTVVLNPDQLHFSDVGFEVRQIFANEVRVLIQKSTANRLKLDLNIELENPSPRMLFINGIAHGHIASSLGSHYGFEIESENNRVELSFRDFSSPPSQWLGRIDVTWSPSPLN